MEIEIDPLMLIDSPYSEETKKIFSFDEIQIEDFISDITLGPQSCYLISGYRGVGKTSLIKRAEELISEKAISEDKSEVIFVYTSFAGFSNANHLVRKLIRELFLKIETSKKYQNDNDEEFKTKLKLLYQRTFSEVSEISDKSTTSERLSSVNLSLSDLMKQVAKNAIPLIGLVIWHFFSVEQNTLAWIVNWLLPIGLVAWMIVNIVNLQFTISKKKQTYNSLYSKTLYDDEIAGTLFFDLMRKAKEKRFKIVYILDELDKVPTEDLNLLIDELKSYLVSGYASFVVVGGQDFYYKFKDQEDVDDSILSSLFSKVFHVSLSSSVLLRELFYKSIIKIDSYKGLAADDKVKLDRLIDYMIFDSRLIPRRFITRLRQCVVWRNQRAFLSDTKGSKYLPDCKTIIDMIDEIDDKSISVEYSGAIRDFIVMKMYINAYRICISKEINSKGQFVNK